MLVVAAARPHRDRFLVLFEGIATREAAEELRGPLYVDAADVRALDEGEFWDDDLVGATAYLPDGSEIGEIAEVVHGPAQDLLSIATPRGERLVPVAAEIVIEVEPQRGRVVIDPPEGLLD